MLYPLLRPLLFRLPPEAAHHLTLHALQIAHRLQLLRQPVVARASTPASCMGITFPNRLGLAAGLDKDATAAHAFAALGFGHVEVGTLTPRPQPGNPAPRLFRLPDHRALINRMGFNNGGVDAALPRLQRPLAPAILGINVGKNAATPLADAPADYLAAFQAVAPLAGYVTVNVSSPNTSGLRDLQATDALRSLLAPLLRSRDALAQSSGRPTPIALKIAPDLSPQALAALAELAAELPVDAVIATNTTLERSAVASDPRAAEPGGLSGEPLRQRATEVIAQLRQLLPPAIPIIGVGGISSGQHAVDKLEAGADLVQLYTGLVYRGPALISEILWSIHQWESARTPSP